MLSGHQHSKQCFVEHLETDGLKALTSMNEGTGRACRNIWVSLSDFTLTCLFSNWVSSACVNGQVVVTIPVALIVLLMIFQLKHAGKNWIPWQNVNQWKIKFSRSLKLK